MMDLFTLKTFRNLARAVQLVGGIGFTLGDKVHIDYTLYIKEEEDRPSAPTLKCGLLPSEGLAGPSLPTAWTAASSQGVWKDMADLSIDTILFRTANECRRRS
jgi:hypothetical protein